MKATNSRRSTKATPSWRSKVHGVELDARHRAVVAFDGAGAQLTIAAFQRGDLTDLEIHADVNGTVLSDEQWNKRRGEFLPSDEDRSFIESLMQPNFEVGKFAGWIAPPKVGIDNKPGDFEYVKIA